MVQKNNPYWFLLRKIQVTWHAFVFLKDRIGKHGKLKNKLDYINTDSLAVRENMVCADHSVVAESIQPTWIQEEFRNQCFYLFYIKMNNYTSTF